MHGCGSGSALLVNAEVDSMGGVIDGGAGIGIKTSPRLAAIEKAQAELRQEYDVREERRRQLEFLEKGGNPLDFKLGNAASVSVQSTSLTNQHHEQFVTSEAKGSFALTASPYGDSVESSGRPVATLGCEPNCADNLMLFDGENEFLEGDRKYVHSSRSKIIPSEHYTQLDGSQNAKEVVDSAAFGLPKKAYRRRIRSRPNRDGARSGSTEAVPSRGGHSSSLPSRNCLRDTKESVSDTDFQKDQNVSMNLDMKPTGSKGTIVLKTVPADNQLVTELDGMRPVESGALTKDMLPVAASDADASKNLWDEQCLQSDAQETPKEMPSAGPKSVVGEEQVDSVGLEHVPCVAITKVDNQAGSGQMNGLSNEKWDTKDLPNEGQNDSAACIKGLDSESSCTQTSLSMDGNNDSEVCTNLRNIDSNGNSKEQVLASEGTPNMDSDKLVKETNENKADDSCAFIKHNINSVHQSHRGNDHILKSQEELNGSGPGLHNGVKDSMVVKGMEPHGITGLETESKPSNLLVEISIPRSENACPSTLLGSMDSSNQELTDNKSSVRVSTVAAEHKACSGVQLKVVNEADEDSILEEARIIEAKRKRIAELSVGTQLVENRRKSQWDYVMEEMAWLANDFAQERLWKITAAARLSYQAAFSSRLRCEEKYSCWKQKNVAHTLAKAVMEFWHSLEETSKEPELKCPEKDFALSVQGYAVRFLKYNSSHILQGQVEAPATPDRMCDLGTLDMSWADHLTEENLLYTVPAGAMETYRKSIESYLIQLEKTGSSMQEEVETSTYDAVPDFDTQDNAYEEDEGETSTYYLPGAFEGSRSTNFAQKKQKNSIKAYGVNSYEVGADLPFLQCMEKKVGTQQSVLMGKRPANSLNVSFPTKRVRTASRQRILNPYSAGTPGSVQAPNKTGASSGDTYSFQDDQSTLHGGFQVVNNMEVESVGDFEKQLPFDSSEVSTKPKKKKKAKHLGSTYEHRWQLDSNFQHEQLYLFSRNSFLDSGESQPSIGVTLRDYSKKRSENHQVESNGTSGNDSHYSLFGQHIVKKPKIVKQSLDNSFDNSTPMVGSIPSPAASQMSNMSNPNKFIKMLGGRDRGRKAKGLKVPAGQPGSGSPWSLFEDQALVVLVHDMGPSWELVSDAINSTLQFKCIFRKPKECKDRHKLLMDRTAGDGADSAEDSGSSQPYPSTLPGIPKGSARQLFQRLQGPMEEDTLKSHFEKIIMIGQKYLYRRSQNDNQEPKQLQQPHGSHTVALSQVCPSNLNGGPILMPLDLCDATVPSPDGQCLHTNGLGTPNQSTVAQMLPASGENSPVQGSSNMILGSNYSSPSGPVNASVRDGRYAIPRTASLSIDEQQRMHQYNQMLSGKNIQQPSLSGPGVPPGTDRGVRMLPGGTGMGIISGLNRSMPMTRPPFQGISSSSMLNSSSMLSSGMVAMPSPVNVHSGAGSGQGSSKLRPRDALHLMRPSQSLEPQRQMMVPDIQLQVSQGNSQGVPPFGGISSNFSNQVVPPAVQSCSLHHQQPQPMTPQQNHVLNNSHHSHLQGPSHSPNMRHQAFAIHLAKERHLQQRMLQQQQQFSAPSALMPHVQPQAQLPISSPLHNSSQSQTSPTVSLSPLTSTSSMTPMSQHQQKHQMTPPGLGRNTQPGGYGLTNQMGKQRQRQPQQQQQQQFQPGGRHHPHQLSQSQQQTKLVKGVGRGNMINQHLPMDPSLLNGLSTAPGSQSTEKGEQAIHLIQGQGLYSASGLNPVQPSKPLVHPQTSNQSQPQQKIYSGQIPPSSKQIQQMPLNVDTSNLGHVPPVTSGPTSSASHQAVSSLGMASSNHQQTQPVPQHHQKLVNQSQLNVQRVLQQNRQVNADPARKLQARDVQADQNSVNSPSQMRVMMTMPQSCVDAINVMPVLSSTNDPQWKESERLYDSGTPNPATQLGSIGSPPLTNSAGSETTPADSHGLSQRQSSGSLSPLGHEVEAQWQQQSSQLHLPPSPPPTQQLQQLQKQQQSTLQQLPPQHPQPQSQLLQAGSTSLYVRSTNSRLE
ncbi:unnamed protein product [Ilex paraguariensis]|uniref:Myb-like domain-containing protein n=1 Tax=Ilex paraguariensis TaxID=185542 RepID=A0ABC8TMA4_9AQUA